MIAAILLILKEIARLRFVASCQSLSHVILRFVQDEHMVSECTFVTFQEYRPINIYAIVFAFERVIGPEQPSWLILKKVIGGS